MRCESCIDIEEQDGVAAACRTPGRKCPIPPLSADEARILEMRRLLVSLKDIVDAGTVLRLHGASIEDLRVLAAVEDGLREKHG